MYLIYCLVPENILTSLKNGIFFNTPPLEIPVKLYNFLNLGVLQNLSPTLQCPLWGTEYGYFREQHIVFTVRAWLYVEF